jgi:site-specific DNA-methyltransferase (adenine-specific)
MSENDSFIVNYNPDILSCLANLSNDEVFTPPELANKMLDILPQEIFSDKKTTFLDPACKSGVFLREIAKRLLVGLESEIPNLQDRIDHIFHKQLYGIAITELTSLLSRRTVYCSKYPNSIYSISNFNDAEGNIRYKKIPHTWNNENCDFCGASKKLYDRDNDLELHAYEFIHTTNFEEIFDMKFDVIIGNPPYQLLDGGGSNKISAKPIYNLFVQQAKSMNPRFLTMIIPSRWFAGGKGLNSFREEMLNDKRIKTIFDFPKSRDCFHGVDIAGGVCYFLWDRNYSGECEFVTVNGDIIQRKVRSLNEFNVLVRDNDAIDIIHKIKAQSEPSLSEVVFTRNSFGFTTSMRGFDTEFENCLTLISSKGKSYINFSDVSKNIDKIYDYKVCIGTLNPDRAGVNNSTDGKMNVTTKIKLLKPSEVVTETYIVINSFKNKAEALNCAQYISTKFARYLISITLSSMHIVRENFAFVPLQDFSKSWTDNDLNEKYGLTDNEIATIESKIRPMEFNGCLHE